MPLNVLSQVGDEPVSLDELKRYLKIDESVTDEDDILLDLIRSARERAETYTRRGLVYACREYSTAPRSRQSAPYGNYSLTFIELPRAPYISLVSVEATDDLGNTTTLEPSSYKIDTSFEPARLYLQDSYISKVRVTYYSGYRSTITSNGKFDVAGDDANQISNINLSGLTTSNTDYFKLYWDIVTETVNGNPVHRLNLYDYIDKTSYDLVAYCDIDNTQRVTTTILPVVTDAGTPNETSTGIGGTINFYFSHDDHDVENVIASSTKTYSPGILSQPTADPTTFSTPPLPASVKNAIMMIAAFNYENRQSVEMPPGAMKMLAPYRILTI